jgi:maleylacetate reductase
MGEVVFGRPAAEAVVAQIDRLRANRAFPAVSGTLNRNTDEIEKIRQSLGSRCIATFEGPARLREILLLAA